MDNLITGNPDNIAHLVGHERFEFVQHTWSDNPNFNGLRQETDPIIGHRTMFGQPQDSFRVQHEPLRCKYRPVPEFVRTRGGGYFFLPGRRALQFLLTG